MVWTLIEPGVAIVASSLVTIRPLLHRMRIKGFVSTENSNTRQYHNRPRTRTSGRAHARPGSMPGFGRGDIRLADMDAPEPGGPPTPPPKQGAGSGAHTSSNGSDVSSLTMPVAVKGAVYSGREVQVDEVPLRGPKI